MATSWHKIDGGKSGTSGYSIKCGSGKGWQRCGEDEEKFECKLDANNHVQAYQGDCWQDSGGTYHAYLVVDGVKSPAVANTGSKKSYILYPNCVFEQKAGNATLHGKEFVSMYDKDGPVYWVDLESRIAYRAIGQSSASKIIVEFSKNNFYYNKLDNSNKIALNPSLIEKKGETRLFPLCRKR